ncbi:hypothetical protein Hokovirus_3_55 [Hokovirus HKV1]|uniref:Uncharacterized protein n=1 Tax=Hokovirus HKV1 TaxID=1977638 RepID=A0A1V0SGE1_9VIRU|nr:hypothetical protein Hokovirus_3_55 [Hokovirus HKV1]
MDKQKYLKYKTKYVKTKILENKNNNVQIILFGNVMTDQLEWERDYNKFVSELKKIGKVIILKPNYVNFLSYSKKSNNKPNENINFTIEDLQFENYAKWIKTQIDKKLDYIAICLDQGCHFAKFFCNKYSKKCIRLYILVDRIFTKENYHDTFYSEMNYNFIKNIVGDDYEKYLIKNLTNETINDLLNKITTLQDNENYIQLLNGLCKGIIRSQYDKIQKMDVKTIIYSDINVLTKEKLKLNITFNEKSNNKIIYYYVNPDTHYLIHSKKFSDEIINNIYGLLFK